MFDAGSASGAMVDGMGVLIDRWSLDRCLHRNLECYEPVYWDSGGRDHGARAR